MLVEQLPEKNKGLLLMSFLFQSSLQKGVNVCATSKTFLWQPKKKNLVIALFGRYLRIKPHDNMLIFLFAKTRGSSLIQSTNIFLWATFTLYSIKYTILDQFSAFFENITPWTAKNISKPVVYFKSWYNTSNWIVCWFAEKKEQPKNAYFERFGCIFWQGGPPENQFSRKMQNLLSFTLY